MSTIRVGVGDDSPSTTANPNPNIEPNRCRARRKTTAPPEFLRMEAPPAETTGARASGEAAASPQLEPIGIAASRMEGRTGMSPKARLARKEMRAQSSAMDILAHSEWRSASIKTGRRGFFPFLFFPLASLAARRSWGSPVARPQSSFWL